MPELPEAERARQQIERALGREIVAVDDRDTYVCRPHAPGEIAAALVGRRCRGPPPRQVPVGRDRRRARTSACTWAWRAGSSSTRPHPIGWDRFVLEFADGGRLALRDKRRLGRAVIEPDFTHVGPDAAEVSRDVFRERVGRGTMAMKARLLDQRTIAGVGNLLADEILWRARLSPLRPRARCRCGARRAAAGRAGGDARRDPPGRSPHGRLHRGSQAGWRVSAVRDDVRAGDDRGADDVLVPRVPAVASAAPRTASVASS